MDPEKEKCVNQDKAKCVNQENIQTKNATEEQPATQGETQAQDATMETAESKAKRERSPAWNHFKKCEDKSKAKCNHCGTVVSIKSAGGVNTSVMLKHLPRCKKLHPELELEVVGGKKFKQATLMNQSSKNKSAEAVPSYVEYNGADCRKALVRMIIKDEMPFRTVEKEGFKEFIYTLQPRFAIPSRRTITRECFSLFLEEKKKLKQLFGKHKGSISLTTDTWTSVQNINYMCVTAHYIDSNWCLQKKILNFCQILSHKGEVMGKLIERCLVSWGISKVFTVTVDNASSNDVGLRFLRRRLQSWGTSMLDGDYLHMRCGAHILNLVVKDGLEENKDSISRIRGAVRYIRSSPARLQKLKECISHLKLGATVGLCLDVPTRWNSTFLMLESALQLKRAFDMLQLEDEKYLLELGKLDGAPTESDWEYLKTYVPILQFFYDATLKVSSTRYVTGNSYMKEVFGVGLMIRKMALNKTDLKQRAMAMKMKTKFDKYWGNLDNMNLVVFVACVMDPRYKLKYVSWLIRESYGFDAESIAEPLIDKVKKVVERMFDYYSDKFASSSKQTSDGDGIGTSTQVSNQQAETYDLDSLIEQHEEFEEKSYNQSELDNYLAEGCIPRTDPNFDILLWWKKIGTRYRILSLMAKDLLAIPVSSVASESAFSTGGRIIDPYRSSLTPKTVEALICTQDWIRRDYEHTSIEEQFQQLEILEDEFANSNEYGNLVKGVSLTLEEEE